MAGDGQGLAFASGPGLDGVLGGPCLWQARMASCMPVLPPPRSAGRLGLDDLFTGVVEEGGQAGEAAGSLPCPAAVTGEHAVGRSPVGHGGAAGSPGKSVVARTAPVKDTAARQGCRGRCRRRWHPPTFCEHGHAACSPSGLGTALVGVGPGRSFRAAPTPRPCRTREQRRGRSALWRPWDGCGPHGPHLKGGRRRRGARRVSRAGRTRRHGPRRGSRSRPGGAWSWRSAAAGRSRRSRRY